MKQLMFILLLMLSACAKSPNTGSPVSADVGAYDFLVTQADGSCATFAENARQQGYLAEIQSNLAQGINPMLLVWRYKLDAPCAAYVASIRHR